MTLLSQLFAMLYKNQLVLRKSTPFYLTLIQIAIIPVLLFHVYNKLLSTDFSRQYPSLLNKNTSYNLTATSITTTLAGDLCASSNNAIAFIPKQHPISAEIRRLLIVHNNLHSCVKSHHFIEFESYDEMLLYYTTSSLYNSLPKQNIDVEVDTLNHRNLYAVIEFNESHINNDPNQITYEYTLHAPPTLLNTNTHPYFDEYNNNPHQDYFLSNTRYSAALTSLVDTALLNLNNIFEETATSPENNGKNGTTPSIQLSLHPLPSYAFNDKTLNTIIRENVQYLLLPALFPAVLLTVLYILADYDLKMIELLIMLNASYIPMISSWYIIFYAVSTPILGFIGYILYTSYFLANISAWYVGITITLYAAAFFTFNYCVVASFLQYSLRTNQPVTQNSAKLIVLYSLIAFGVLSVITLSPVQAAIVEYLKVFTTTIDTLIGARNHQSRNIFLFLSSLTDAQVIAHYIQYTMLLVSFPYLTSSIISVLFTASNNTDTVKTISTGLNQYSIFSLDALFAPAGSIDIAVGPQQVAAIIPLGYLFGLLMLQVLMYGAIGTYILHTISPSQFTKHSTSIDHEAFKTRQPNPYLVSPPNPGENDRLALSATNVHKVYTTSHSTVHAVNGVSLNLYYGSILSFVGLNGAGKSTLTSLLTSSLTPTHGTVEYHQPAPSPDKTTPQATQPRAKFGVVLQHNTIYPNLTPYEHIQMMAKIQKSLAPAHQQSLLPDFTRDNILALTARVALGNEFVDRPVGLLSGGQIRKTLLAMALVYSPTILLCDELTAGVDIHAQRSIWNELLRVRQEHNTAVFMTTHSFTEASIGDKIAILRQGQLISYGTQMFLKNAYGVGYQLVLSFNDHEDSHKLTKKNKLIEFLMKFSVGSSIDENNGAMTFVIPIPSSDQQTARSEEELVELLEQVEKAKQEECSAIKEYSLTITTLHDVFKKAIEGGDDARLSKIPFEEKKIQNNESNTHKSAPSKQSTTPQFLQQVYSILYKRFFLSKYDFVTTVLTLLLPSLCIILIIYFALTLLFTKTYTFNSLTVTPQNIFNQYPIYYSQYPQISHNHLNGSSIQLNNAFSSYLSQTVKISDSVNLGGLFDERPDLSNQTHPYRTYQISDLYSTHLYTNQVNPAPGYVPTPSKLHNMSYINIFTPNFQFNSKKQQIEEIQTLLFINSTSHYTQIPAINHFTETLLNYVEIQRSHQDISHITDQRPPTQQKKFSIISHFHNLPNYHTLRVLRYLMVFVLVFIFILYIPSMFTFILAENGMLGAATISNNNSIIQHYTISNLSQYAYWFGNLLYDNTIGIISVIILLTVLYFIDMMSGMILPTILTPSSLLSLGFVLVLYNIHTIIFAYNYTIFYTILVDISRSAKQLGLFLNNEIAQILLVLILAFSHLIYLGGASFAVFFYQYPMVLFAFGIIFPPYLALPMIVMFDENLKKLVPFVKTADHMLLVYLTVIMSNLLFCLVLLSTKKRLRKYLLSRTHPATQKIVENSESNTLDYHMKDEDFPVIVHCLSKDYYNPHTKQIFSAVQNVSFKIKRGTVYALLGPNSAGKSTTLGMLVGEVVPTKRTDQFSNIQNGTAYLNGFDIITQWDECLASNNIGYIPQTNPLHDQLSAYQHVYMYSLFRGVASVSGSGDNDPVVALLAKLGLDSSKIHRPMKTLSGGERRRAMIAAVLISHPTVLICDELTNACDIISKSFIYKAIKQSSNKDQQSVLLTSHYLDEVELLSNDVGIMSHGKLVVSGDLYDLKQNFAKNYIIGLEFNLNYTDNNDGYEDTGDIFQPPLDIVKTLMKNYFSTNFDKTITITEQRYNSLTFTIEKHAMTLPQVFTQLCRMKNEILKKKNKNGQTISLTYSISETTLEQIFLHLAGAGCAE